jgi:4-carboxymuconolactone decarboxylase
MGKFDDLPEERRRGLERIEEVYGFEMTELLLIGLVTGTGAYDVLTIQVPAALRSGDLDAEALREIVIFLCHYAGWPSGSRLGVLVEETVAQAQRST